MGQSDHLPDPGAGSYSFQQHRHHLDAFLRTVGVDDGVVLVGHDWGGLLAFDWARRHPAAVQGIAYMEAMVRPRLWDEEPEGVQQLFRALRSPEGERMILQDNVFIETVLRGAIPHLSDADLATYRAPFEQAGEGRRAMLAWVRQIPFDGEPSDIADIVTECGQWLASSTVPKLFIAAEPGAVLAGDARHHCEQFVNQTVDAVRAGHFVPEDAPQQVTAALTRWLGVLRG